MKPTDSLDRATGRVLVVDDELAVARAHERTLTQAGHDVVVATDGLRARELLEQGGFAAVLSDVWMPGVDGFDLLRAARGNDPRVSVILMTGAPTAEGADAAAANGALMYLAKPVELRSLLQVVGYACHVHRQAQPGERSGGPLDATAKDSDDLASCSARFENALRSMFMMYQPIVRPRTLEVAGYEALLRSAEPTMGQPLSILAAAERLQRIHELGRAVRDRVAAVVSALPKDISMFVNLHPHDLADESLFSPKSPLSQVARRVVLELTERASLDDVPDLLARVARLRRLGFRIAIDDLGAGYASLTAFAQVRPEVVKLDMTLVRGVHLDPMKRMLVDTLITMSRKLGLLVVCEGVETVEERDVLAGLGCERMQGYLFGRPERTFPTSGARLEPPVPA